MWDARYWVNVGLSCTWCMVCEPFFDLVTFRNGSVHGLGSVFNGMYSLMGGYVLVRRNEGLRWKFIVSFEKLIILFIFVDV